MSQDASPLTSTRPYLLRAMHEWMTDNAQTPLIVVDATLDGVQVPVEHVKDGSIVLNVSWSATRNLQLGADDVFFEARFGGLPHQICVPMAAIQGIYARESGQGMMFQDQPAGAAAERERGDAPVPNLGGDGGSEAGNKDDSSSPDKPGGPPSLRIVK